MYLVLPPLTIWKAATIGDDMNRIYILKMSGDKTFFHRLGDTSAPRLKRRVLVYHRHVTTLSKARLSVTAFNLAWPSQPDNLCPTLLRPRSSAVIEQNGFHTDELPAQNT